MKAKGKYLVTTCNNAMLELRKFSSSQIRAKSYTVPKYDCVKVIPDPITKQRDLDAEITFPIGTYDELVEIPSSTVPDPKLDIRPPLPDAFAVPPIHTDLTSVPAGTDNEFVIFQALWYRIPKLPILIPCHHIRLRITSGNPTALAEHHHGTRTMICFYCQHVPLIHITCHSFA